MLHLVKEEAGKQRKIPAHIAGRSNAGYLRLRVSAIHTDSAQSAHGVTHKSSCQMLTDFARAVRPGTATTRALTRGQDGCVLL